MNMEIKAKAIATVATEAVEAYMKDPAVDPELTARVWADLSSDLLFEDVSGGTVIAMEPYEWALDICSIADDFNAWLNRHSLYGSLVDKVGTAVLDSCLEFVRLA